MEADDWLPGEKQQQFSMEPLTGGGQGKWVEAMRRADNHHFQSRYTFLISSQVKLAVGTTVGHVGAETSADGVEGGPASGRHVGESREGQGS